MTVTVDSQDGCRYITQNGRCVATGFQPVGDGGSSRGSDRPSFLQRDIDEALIVVAGRECPLKP